MKIGGTAFRITNRLNGGGSFGCGNASPPTDVIYRNCIIRVLRNEKNIFEGSIISLKRFKDDVQEVLQNYECGMVLEFSEIENGDIVEAYEQIEESAKLS